jgi:hypothetical protein
MEFSNTFSQEVYKFSFIIFLLKFHKKHYCVFSFSLLTVVFYSKLSVLFTEAKLLKFLILRIAFLMYGKNF